jgi:PPOX class probable F420-dependent enzyme
MTHDAPPVKSSFTPTERAFIDRHRVARLATSDLHGAPHVIPIVYASEDDAVYFIVDDKPKRTHTGLKRLRNIEQNPRVALLIDDYDEDWTSLAYLLIHGRAAVVADREEYARVLSALRARYPQYRPMRLATDSHPMVRITRERGRLWQAVPER